MKIVKVHNEITSWLLALGLIETAQIRFPGHTRHYTDDYIDYMATFWDRKEK